jgi:2-polyprenyl-3-methyl-5-hydroxy-6-metoxy-1,4-benzoquinol methylase
MLANGRSVARLSAPLVPRLSLTWWRVGQRAKVTTHDCSATRWDAEADRYDDEPDHGLRDPVVRHVWRRTLRDNLPSPPAHMLDVACGTGSLAVLAAEDGYRVTGIDASPSMLAVARRKALDAGVDLTLIVRDVTCMPIGRDEFDVILARYVVWLLPDPVTAVQDWLQMTRPGGVLVLIEDRFWPSGDGSVRDLLDVVAVLNGRMTVMVLDDPRLWGGSASDDERVMVVCR